MEDEVGATFGGQENDNILDENIFSLFHWVKQ